MNRAGRPVPEGSATQDPTHLPRVPGGRPAGRDRCARPRTGPALRRGAVASCLLIALLGADPLAWGASRESAEAPPEDVFHLRNGSQVQTSRYTAPPLPSSPASPQAGSSP